MEEFEEEFEMIGDDVDDPEIIMLTELGSTLINAILEKEPISNVRDLIDAGAPLWYQNEEGTSVLHAAAYVENEQLVKLLIEEGAVWNAVDNLQNTAGDIALSLNDAACYTLIRDAGIRSEMLLTLLSSQTSLNPTPSSLVLQGTDNSAVASTDAFLSSHLRYTRDVHGQDICLLELDDGQEVGVMMGWERDIMQKTVEKLCIDHAKRDKGLKVLNVGFGLGIIDDFFQNLSTPPALHVIVEPHHDVLAHMKEQGWYDKKGVSILEGKWQDCIASEALQGFGKFDVIYTDTFSENYSELHTFFKHLRELLAGPESRFSFFNGLGATNVLFYDVYTHLSELHLAEVGLDVAWSDVDVSSQKDEERWGETRKYFSLPIYRLPIAWSKEN
ncbi:arginine methyl transferase [Rhizopogon vinicolor AM-OR11-026]|uniref:Arginine methyl transferase n=1 Tax=Rhizopogon vinicolor AM-OR11-026 TaxID=1314800 RepID=A0A1B7NEY4_9AGAM|nr:arginine methyl transferase [Rhizopogon vinicolor AM-OR11-026]